MYVAGPAVEMSYSSKWRTHRSVKFSWVSLSRYRGSGGFNTLLSVEHTRLLLADGFPVHTSSSLGLCWQTLFTRDRNSAELAGTVTGRLAIDYPVTVASAVASETADMVAKDYPFYLVLKRANYALEVQTVRGNPVKEAEVGVPNRIPAWFPL